MLMCIEIEEELKELLENWSLSKGVSKEGFDCSVSLKISRIQTFVNWNKA